MPQRPLHRRAQPHDWGGPAPTERHRVVAVISGPEPQRTLLEDLLTDQLQRVPGEHLLVRGLPKVHEVQRSATSPRCPHLQASDLAERLMASEHIVSRSGYTTLMD
ncbi:MAG: hypothetical protein IPN62_10840, partial [Flavobacteriales bacterium]|nr:hypothetical protein [Flavobacteriales bacterium]